MASLAVIIPNLNGKKLLKKSLNSLRQQTYPDFKVYVVDNGSTDGSSPMVNQEFPAVRLIQLTQNTGFARANNLGIQAALKENPGLKYICPLNNDVEVNPDYLEELVRAAKHYQEKGQKLGILAAKLLFKEDPDLINSVGTVIQLDGSGMERGFKEKDRGQYEKSEEIFGSCAAAALYTTRMLKKIAHQTQGGQSSYFGYFDEDFFAYYEDLDLNYRSRLAGFKAFYIPKAIGYHWHSATGRSYSPFKSFHVHRNQYYVLIKNFPLPFLVLGLAFMPVRYLLLILSLLIGRGPSAQLNKNLKKNRTKIKKSGKKSKLPSGIIRIVFFSWLDIIKHLPALIKKRRRIQQKRVVKWPEFGQWLKKYRASWRRMIFE